MMIVVIRLSHALVTELDFQDDTSLDASDTPPYQNTSASLEVPPIAGLFAFQEPLPAQLGTPPLIHASPPPFLLMRRQCLENGSNFCFDNSVDSCPSCRACCTSSSTKWCCDVGNSVCCEGQRCCPAGGTCCGTGCCTAGSTCRNGKCENSASVYVDCICAPGRPLDKKAAAKEPKFPDLFIVSLSRQ
jgi:hypothetical protein